MAKYWLSYSAEFKSFGQVNYRIEIYDSELTEDAEKPLILAASPLVISNTTDDITSPIKALVARIKYVNDGTMPLTAFYSENDTRFKLIVKKNNQITFVGYLVQDDCAQTIGELTQVVNLQFTDNLGLLKDINLDEAAANFIYTETYTEGFANISNAKLLTIEIDDFGFAVGDVINVVTNTETYKYTIQTVTNNFNGTFTFLLDVDLFDSAFYANFEFVNTAIKPYDVRSLLNLLTISLQGTGLVLNIRAFSQIIWDGATGNETFFVTRMLGGSFYDSNDKFASCYQVLTDILGSLNATLQQHLGYWYIVRKPERLYNDGDFVGYEYSGYGLNTMTNLTANFDVDITDIEADGIVQIVRPYEYTQRDFAFKNPPLIVNSKLTSVGTEITGYDPDKLYELPTNSTWRIANNVFPNNWISGAIKVDRDPTTLAEIDRTMSISNGNFDFSTDTLAYIESNQFLVQNGDKLSLQINHKCGLVQSGRFVITLLGIFFKLNNNTYNFLTYDSFLGWGMYNTADIEGDWDEMITKATFVQMNTTDVYTNIQLTDYTLNFDGIGFIRYYPAFEVKEDLSQYNPWFYQVRIKDFSSQITYANNIKIISQTNKCTQTVTKKSNLIESVKIDDSPRTSFSGTLFKSTGNIPQLTTLWNRGYGITETLKLGDIITFEKLFFNRKPRTKYDFTLQFSNIEPINILAYDSKLFLLGRFDIDCERDSVNCTAYELMERDEDRSNLTATNTFNYNYE